MKRSLGRSQMSSKVRGAGKVMIVKNISFLMLVRSFKEVSRWALNLIFGHDIKLTPQGSSHYHDSNRWCNRYVSFLYSDKRFILNSTTLLWQLVIRTWTDTSPRDWTNRWHWKNTGLGGTMSEIIEEQLMMLTIYKGPGSLLIAYAFVGLIVSMVMFGLGEMAAVCYGDQKFQSWKLTLSVVVTNEWRFCRICDSFCGPW